MALRRYLHEQIYPFGVTYTILERYAELRRGMRPAHGSGLIGDMDTLIAATALEHGLTVVTLDSDFLCIPSLVVMRLSRSDVR